MTSILIPTFVCVLAVMVLLSDLAFGPADSRRGTGALTAAGLVGILAATWFVPLTSGFGGAFITDAFTLYVQRILLVAGAVAAIGTIDHADRVFPSRQGEYYLLLVSTLVGMTLLAGARDLILIAVSFELMGIPTYVLTAMHKDRKQGVEGAVKLYLTGAISAAITIYGLSFLIGAAGSSRLDAVAATQASPTYILGAMLAFAGMAYKVGAVPFHMWVPDTYQSAPTPFVAFLSVAPKAATFATFARILLGALGDLRPSWGPLVLIVCGVTMVVGNLLAIPQNNVRRLLAYSGIAHVGLLLLTLAIDSTLGVAAMVFYLATYVGSNMGAFFVVEAVGDELGDYNGLARRNPGLALAMLLFLLSLGGIPFVAGFWGKVFIFWAAWQAGEVWLVLLGALLAVVGLFFYLRIARAIYIEPPGSLPCVQTAPTTLWAIALALGIIVGMGVLPRPFFDAALLAGKAIVPTHTVAAAAPTLRAP